MKTVLIFLSFLSYVPKCHLSVKRILLEKIRFKIFSSELSNKIFLLERDLIIYRKIEMVISPGTDFLSAERLVHFPPVLAISCLCACPCCQTSFYHRIRLESL